jgi:hypothetical protein
MIHRRACQPFDRVLQICAASVQKEPSIDFDRRLSNF